MASITVKVTSISWDTDGEYVDLPQEFEIPMEVLDPSDEMEIEDLVDEFIDAVYGFCHDGYAYEVVE